MICRVRGFDNLAFRGYNRQLEMCCCGFAKDAEDRESLNFDFEGSIDRYAIGPIGPIGHNNNKKSRSRSS